MKTQMIRTMGMISLLTGALLFTGCVIHTAGSASTTTSKKNNSDADTETAAEPATPDDSADEAPGVVAPEKAVKKSNMKRAGRPTKTGGEKGTGGGSTDDDASETTEDDDASSSEEGTGGDDAGSAEGGSAETQSSIDSAKQKAEEILKSYQNPK